jgi:hypothetical protein
MSDLIDRYLAAIARELPEAQRADITAELRDELMSQLEGQEERLGRPLTMTELEAALRDFGNPLVVAGRYRKTQHLIGPQILPFWWQAIRVTLTVIAAVYVVLIVLALLVQTPSERDVPSPVLVLGFAFGLITFMFAMVERYGNPEKLARRWRPRRLPPARGKTKGRFEIMVEIGMTLVALAWWIGLIHFQNVMPGTELKVDLATVWADWYWWIVAYWIGELIVNGHALLQPARVRLNAGLAIVRNLAGATILFNVRQAGHFVDVSSPYIPADSLVVVQANFDRGFGFGIGAAIAIFIVLAAVEAWRLRGFLRANAGPQLA